MDSVKKISDLLYDYFDFVYCDDCRHNCENTGECDECHRKYMNWAISREDSNSLAKRIVEALENKEEADEINNDKHTAEMV